MEINTEEVKRLAELLLSANEIAVTLGYNIADVKEMMDDDESDFFRAFISGRAAARIKLNEVNFKLMELGAPNALKSIQEQL